MCSKLSIPGTQHNNNDPMIIVFTCKVCETRAARKMSKGSYEKGVVIIRCPGCDNLHLIADRLGFFEDNSTDIESMMKARGEIVSRGVLDDHVMDLTEEELIRYKASHLVTDDAVTNSENDKDSEHRK